MPDAAVDQRGVYGMVREACAVDVVSSVGDLLAAGGAVEGDSEALTGPDSVQFGGEGKEEERGEHGRTP